jgi:hypothetical protein
MDKLQLVDAFQMESEEMVEAFLQVRGARRGGSEEECISVSVSALA